ncbi:hypothetical protein DJ62_2550 [Yersinia enterocolitica]|nr:hypothetical protein DJ62_2550 [Yersinia enterocolitica]
MLDNLYKLNSCRTKCALCSIKIVDENKNG